jgi:hypothetical protein
MSLPITGSVENSDLFLISPNWHAIAGSAASTKYGISLIAYKLQQNKKSMYAHSPSLGLLLE